MKAAVVASDKTVKIEDRELRPLKYDEALVKNGILWCMPHRFTRKEC